MVRQAPVICVMAPPIHLGAWSMALMLWLPFELLLLESSSLCSCACQFRYTKCMNVLMWPFCTKEVRSLVSSSVKSSHLSEISFSDEDVLEAISQLKPRKSDCDGICS